ncbi:MAG: heme exporter protein CcmB [Acidobacteriota bacterium]|nr:heme exporter protein CcmB [Acidobacteriota bacterium]
MKLMRPVLVLLLKDLRVEWRGRVRFLSIVLFGGITLVLFSFAIDADGDMAATMAPGFLTLALLLSSTLGLSESFRVERENRSLEGLLLLPVEPAVLFYAKALGNFVFLAMLAPVLVPSAIILYSVETGPAGFLGVVAVWLLAAAALAAPGTLYAAMTSRAASQDVLLPLLLFPLVIPVLIASVRSAELLLHGDPMDQAPSWLLLLAAFDVIYWALGGVLARVAMEE